MSQTARRNAAESVTRAAITAQELDRLKKEEEAALKELASQPRFPLTDEELDELVERESAEWEAQKKQEAEDKAAKDGLTQKLPLHKWPQNH